MFGLRWIAMLGLGLAGPALPLDSAFAFRAYVSNEKGNSISVIDTDKMVTVATIQTGQRPRGIEVLPRQAVVRGRRRRRQDSGLVSKT